MSKTVRKQPLGVNSSKINSMLDASFSKKANKSLVSIQGGHFLQLSQNEVSFINTDPNQIYEISFTIRNVGQKSTKLKIRKPKSDFLTVALQKDGTLAPGLEKKITVTYNSQINEQIKDKLEIYADDQYQMQVPVNVYPIVHNLIYEPFVNFGFLKVGSTKQHPIKITNKGNHPAQIRLQLQIKGAKAMIEPSNLCIQPNSTEIAILFISSEQPCQFQGSIEIHPQLLSQTIIDIVGSFCQYSRYVSDQNGKQLNQLFVKPMFGGQKWSSSFNLVNNTSKPCQFRIIRKRGSNSHEDQDTLITPQQFGRDDEQKTICFSTIEGQMQAYSRKQISCSIIAKIDEQDQQNFCNYIAGRIKLLPYDSKHWSYLISTTFKDEDSAKNMIIRGESLVPKLSLSSIFFKFNDCSIRSKQEKILKIQNFSDRAVPITIQKSQNYCCIPESFEVQKDGYKQVIIKFNPKVVGQLHQICHLKIAMFSFPIKMLGKGTFVVQNARKTSTKQSIIGMDQSRGVEMSVADLDKSLLQQEISIINDKSHYVEENSKITTTNFDCTVLTHKAKTQNINSLKKKAIKNKNGKQVILNMQNFNPDQEVQQYSGLGRNAQQDRVVSRELNLNEFKNIPVGPVVIDFGEIFVSSAQKKTFHICNLNIKPISIQVETKGVSQFEKSSKQVQILPGESHGGLKIVYQANQQGPFKHSLQYVLNGRHYFEFLAVGTAILPTIQPSKTQFKFVANQDDHTFQKKQTFILNNTYPYQVEYSIVNQKQSLFKLSPSKGKLQPFGKQNICIVHNFLGLPEGGGKVQQNLKLKIKNGKKIDLKCISVVPECFVICKPNECNFKQISICKQHEMKFSIRNSSKNFTIFKLSPNKQIEEDVIISSTKTTLATDEVAEITVKIMSQKQQVIDSGLTITVRGGRKIFIPIRANMIIPKVKVEGDQINFGSMPVGGNPTSKQINLINQSPIPAQIQLVISMDSFLYNTLSMKCQSNQQRTVLPPKEIKEKRIKIFLIKIAKKCKAQVCLQFQPEQVKDYRFALPFYLAGSSEINPFLQKSAVCRSLKNRLLVDHKQLDFGKTIIQQNLENIPKHVNLVLRNPQQQQIEWWVSEKNLEPFSLQTKKGKIQGESQVKIKVLFNSQSPGTFEKELHFFVNNSDFQPTRPYLKLPIKATAFYPEIYFDQPYLILPTVRLNQQSTGKFQIINGGYENLNLKHVISQEYSNIDLNVKYLNGCNLGITKKSIPVVITFKSQKAISFTLKIDFYDQHNRIFSIFISGTADSSLYSLPQSNWGPDPAQEIAQSASFLASYLNAIGFADDILYDFPSCLCDNDFQYFQKLLQHFSPQFEKLEKLRTNIKKSNNLQEIYEYLSEAIKLLKSEGAFLNQIRPQFLMNENDYYELLKIKSENARVYSNFKLPTPDQVKLNKVKSWIILIYQVLKVNSKVVSKKKSTTNDFWSQMMLKQKTIINWLEQSYQNQANLEQIKSSNDLNDLKDGQMLSALITKYTNIKVLQSYGKPCNVFKQKQKRCRKIIQIFAQIGITPGVKVQDLLRSKPIEMLVFLERLYMILPYYLQKGDPIVFSCAIGQSLTKTIQIKNPSKFPVTYIAKIQGSKAYIIQNQQQFQIDSKQKHQVQIKYISNIDIDKANATLTLTGKTSSKFTPSTFIFVLKSVSLGRISQKSVQVTGQLYQPYQFQLNVKNNFPVDTTFNIQIASNNSKTLTKSLYCTTPVVKIKKDETTPIVFVFFPFIFETQKYQILFKDPKVGQFQYDLTGLVQMPQVIQQPMRLNQTFFTNKTYTVQLVIPQKNQQISRARKQIDTYLQKIQRKAQSQLISQNKKNSTILAPIEKNPYPLLKSQNYSLSLSPQTEMVTLKTNTIVIDPQEDETTSSIKKVYLDINMKMPVKDAAIYLIMKNNSNNDIRRYKILINSIYKPLRYELEMRVPVNQSITQPLPLINISNDPNTFNVTFTTNQSTTNRNAFVFNNQKDLIVKAKEQSVVNLTFNPKLQQTYVGFLKIENITVGQIIEYQINGIGEQPVAQNLRFEQQTNQAKKYQLKMPYIRPQKCTVSKCTFAASNIKYEKNFWYSSQPNCLFKFEFISKVPGIYEGKIQIQDQAKIHAFNITIIVTQSIAGVIQVKSIERVRKDVTVILDKGHWVVQNFNPSVAITQEIQMREKGPFVFSYTGSKAGEITSDLIFKNQALGYLKYLIRAKIDEQPQTIISDLKAELGKYHVTIVQLHNPDSHSMTVTGTCTNQQVFFYEPEGSFTIPPKSKKEVKILYRPTCLEEETGKVYFTSSTNIKWKYDLSGCGCLQNEQQFKQVDAQVGQQIVETIVFMNPFKKKVIIHIFLENQKDNTNQATQFKLVTKNSKHSLQYLQQIEIPIKFTPLEVKKYVCKLKILINQKIFWRYDISVRTIYRSMEETRTFKIPCRNKKQLTTQFILPYLSKQMLKNQKVRCVLTPLDSNYQVLMKSTCRTIKDFQTLNQNKVSFLLNFLSYRPFVCPFIFQLYQQNNCKWIFKGQIQYTTPPPDDEFQIITEINKASSVMFRLNNRIKSHAKFKTYFTSDSDMQFSISPKSGDLQPYGREGTQFQVTFAPTQYRNSWHGKIIIETDQSFWSYIVKGNLPHYIPPVGKSNLSGSMTRRFTTSNQK